MKAYHRAELEVDWIAMWRSWGVVDVYHYELWMRNPKLPRWQTNCCALYTRFILHISQTLRSWFVSIWWLKSPKLASEIPIGCFSKWGTPKKIMVSLCFTTKIDWASGLLSQNWMNGRWRFTRNPLYPLVETTVFCRFNQPNESTQNPMVHHHVQHENCELAMIVYFIATSSHKQ